MAAMQPKAWAWVRSALGSSKPEAEFHREEDREFPPPGMKRRKEMIRTNVDIFLTSDQSVLPQLGKSCAKADPIQVCKSLPLPSAKLTLDKLIAICSAHDWHVSLFDNARTA